MTSLRSLVIAVVVAASFVPAFAMAQVYNTSNCNTSWYQWGSTNCTVGNLLVYVQVNNNNGMNRVPSDFTVTVNAPTASPTSFPGSISGTSVLVGGSYSVTVLQQQGFSASYSAGCTGTLSNNSQSTCIVTESNTTSYSTYPNTYYPNQYYPTYYPYNGSYVAPLTCSPSGQTVTIGQAVTFTAQGGEFSQFNWSNSSVPNSTSYNVGRSYTTTLLSPGTATISVTNGQQTANCSVSVVGYPVAGYNYGGFNISTVGTYPTVTVTPNYIPRLPNTGFEPLSAAGITFVLAFLLAAGLVSYRYVRQLFTIALR